MKVFFDTEFTGLHKGTTLISIGMIAEDGSLFYAELTDYDESQCNEWIKENIIKHLHANTDVAEPNAVSIFRVGDRAGIKKALQAWLKQFNYIEFVSDVCHYDFVLLIDLFGTAFDLPYNVSPSCYDINQDIAQTFDVTQAEAFDMSREDILYRHYKCADIVGSKHDALYDAKIIRELYQKLHGVEFFTLTTEGGRITNGSKHVLGLMPRTIWESHRIEAIKEAITRFLDAGVEIPEAWIEEYNTLISGKAKAEEVFRESLSRYACASGGKE